MSMHWHDPHLDPPPPEPRTWIPPIVCILVGLIVLFFATRANCQERPKNDDKLRLTSAAFVGLAATDVYQTTTALQSGRFVEGNPAAKTFASQPWALAATKAGTVTATFAAVHSLRAHGHPKLAWIVLGSMTAVQGATVAWNARQLSMVKR